MTRRGYNRKESMASSVLVSAKWKSDLGEREQGGGWLKKNGIKEHILQYSVAIVVLSN